MLQFRTFLEVKEFTSITPETIEWWSKYAKNRIFKSEKEARDWIFYQKERTDKEFAHVFSPDGTEYNRKFADIIPIYQSGKSFKIGKRIKKDNRFRLKHLQVKLPSLEELNEIAQANGESDYRFRKVTWIPVSWGMEENDYYFKRDLERIKNLAQQIKENGWIEAVVYHYNEHWVIEGQHRIRAMYLLGFKTVPGVGIEYL